MSYKSEVIRKALTPSVLGACLGIGGAVTSPSITLATWTKVVLGLTANDNNGFAWDAVNERFYLADTGVTNRKFIISAATSVSTVATNHLVEFVMYKNGVAQDCTYVPRYIASSDVGALSTPGTITLSTNDYIELFVRMAKTSTMTFQAFSLVVKEY